MNIIKQFHFVSFYQYCIMKVYEEHIRFQQLKFDQNILFHTFLYEILIFLTCSSEQDNK